MFKGSLIESLVFGINIIHLLSVDPCSAEETRTFSLLLADDFPATNAITYEFMDGRLAVAYLAAWNEVFAQVTPDNLGALRCTAAHLFILLIGLGLNLLHLLSIRPSLFHPLH